MKRFILFISEEKRLKVIVPLISIFIGFVGGAIIMLLSGNNPIEAYGKLFEGAGFAGNIRRFGDTLLNMTTLILTGLSVAFAFRTGLFNIGAAGQMLMGGFVAVFIGIKLNLPYPYHVIIAVLGAIIAGALWAVIPGVLKARYRIHEVVTTIMMNWIAVWTVYYLVPTYIRGSFDTESSVIAETASLRTEWLSGLFGGSYVNIGLFLALIAVFIVWFILKKTTFGYSLKAVGFSPDAARYAGMNVNRNMVYSMMISGALAGLAGAVFYLGYANNIKIGVLPPQGFDGIVVALVGLSTPVGVLFASFLFGVLNAGKLFMQSATDVPNELVPIINAMIIFLAATGLLFKRWFIKLRKSVLKKGDEK